MALAARQGWQILGVFSIAAWVLSLALPVGGGHTGLDILKIGWMGLAFGNFGFLANISVLFGSLLLFLRRSSRLWTSLILAIFTLLVAYFAAVWDGFLLSTNMGKIDARPFGAGYYLWFLAVLIAGFSPAARELVLCLRSKTSR